MSHEPIRLTAAQLLKQGDVDAALGVYERAVREGDGDLSVLAEYAFLLWRTYEFERGAELFARLLGDPRTDAATLLGIAKRFFQTGRFGQAADAMRVAVSRSDAVDPETVALYAGALQRNNQRDAAREQAQRAAAIDPGSVRATQLLAHLEKREGNFDGAVRRLQLHLRTYPSDLDWRLRYEMAASLDRLGEYDAAWEQLVLAKAQLWEKSRPHLSHSYQIRKRQADLVRQVTDADLKRWHNQPLEREPRQRIAFMAGFPRSGTTLLEQILTAHPECVGTDETGILSTQFIAPIVRSAKASFDALIEIRSLDHEQLSTGRRVYRKFTEAFLGEPVGTRLLIEKDPLLTPDLCLPLRLFPEASMIMPLRDPRDVVVSFFFLMVPVNSNSAAASNIRESAQFYHDCMRHWLLLRNRLPWPQIEIRYEDIVEDQATETKRLARFLHLPWNESMLDSGRRSQKKGVRTPTYDDITKPIYRRAVGRWRNYTKHLAPALSILKPYASEFGYE